MVVVVVVVYSRLYIYLIGPGGAGGPGGNRGAGGAECTCKYCMYIMYVHAWLCME